MDLHAVTSNAVFHGTAPNLMDVTAIAESRPRLRPRRLTRSTAVMLPQRPPALPRPRHKRGQAPPPMNKKAPINTRKGPVLHEQGPPHKNYCGSHLLSHNHQVAVPSARMGLATGIGTVNRAFPHHYHHRKTNRPPHPTHQSGGSSPRTAQRTRTPQTMQPPHTKGGLATNEHTTHSRTHQPKKVNE